MLLSLFAQYLVKIRFSSEFSSAIVSLGQINGWRKWHLAWYTLFTAPDAYFAKRRYALGWLRVAISLGVVEALLSMAQLPYALKSAQYLALFAHKTAAQAAAIRSSAMAVAPVEGFFSVWMSILMMTVVLWLVARAFSTGLHFRQVLSIVTHASVIALIGALLSTAASVLSGHLITDFLSLGMFASPGSRAQAILGSVGVINVWMLWVETAGVAALAGISKRKAAAPVLVSWLLMILLSAGL